jgi:hypothetical protein
MIWTAQYAQIGLELWHADKKSERFTEDDVLRELEYLAGLAKLGTSAGGAASALSLMLDVAVLREDAGDISAIFISTRPMDRVDELLDVLQRVLPILGAEMIHCWAEGIFAMHISTEYDPFMSYQGRVIRGEISNHGVISMTQNAARQMKSHRPI